MELKGVLNWGVFGVALRVVWPFCVAVRGSMNEH